MSREKWITAFWSVLVSFLLSFSAVAGLASAFQMQVSVWVLAQVCLVVAVLATFCYSLPLGIVPPAAFIFALGYYFRNGALELTVESLLYRLSRQYNMGYGWPIIRWSGRIAEQMEQTLPLALCLLGALIAFLICRGICRKKSVAFGVVPDVLCLAVCFVVNDTPPGTVFVYLQLVCLLVLLLTTGVRRRDASQGNRLTLITMPVLALAILVLFACVPRKDYSNENAVKFSKWFTESEAILTLLGRVEDQADNNSVDLTQVGYQTVSQIKAMEITADFSGNLYLRGRALDQYDGMRWTKGDMYNLSDLNWPSNLDTAGVVEIKTKYAHSMLYVPYYASSKNMRESAFGVENGNKLTEYSFSTLAVPGAAQLQQYYAHVSELRNYAEQYIKLPESVRNWATPLMIQLTSQTTDVQQLAQKIAEYVQNSAVYDTNTPRMPSRETDFVQWFLEDSDTGYCVHFATATTVLLQAAGIPARYVTGYMVQAVAGETVDITGGQAHAWCEYWLPGFGWTILEATPPDLRQETNEETAQSQQEPEQTTPNALQNQTQNPSEKSAIGDVVQILLGVAMVAGVVWLQYALRVFKRKKYLQKGNTNRQALSHWHYAEQLANCLGQTPPQHLQGLAEKAKFSQYTLTELELAAFAQYELEAIVSLKKKNIFLRFYFRLVLALY